MAKKMTIEDLARVVQDGFYDARNEMNEFREEIKDQFRLIDGRLDIIEKIIGAIKNSSGKR